jgi:hypothetical protein
MPSRTKAALVLVFGIVSIAVLVVSCAPQAAKKLKDPAVYVYKPPEIWVTHPAPMVATEIAEDDATSTAQPDIFQPPPGPTLDEQQYLLDDIDYLFGKIENTLNNTNLNP